MTQYMKIATALGLMLLGAFGAWYTTSDHYQKRIAEMQKAQQTAVAEALTAQLAAAAAHDKQLHDAGDQHAKDQLLINSLTSQLGRVHINFPSGGAVPQGGTGTGNQDGDCRVAAARADEYMAEAQRAINDIGQRCAQLNIDAIQSNAVNR